MATQDTPTDGVSFTEPEEWRLVRSSLDEFVEREVRPLEDDLGETWSNPRVRHDDGGRYVEEAIEAVETVRQKSAEAGAMP